MKKGGKPIQKQNSVSAFQMHSYAARPNLVTNGNSSSENHHEMPSELNQQMMTRLRSSTALQDHRNSSFHEQKNSINQMQVDSQNIDNDNLHHLEDDFGTSRKSHQDSALQMESFPLRRRKIIPSGKQPAPQVVSASQQNPEIFPYQLTHQLEAGKVISKKESRNRGTILANNSKHSSSRMSVKENAQLLNNQNSSSRLTVLRKANGSDHKMTALGKAAQKLKKVSNEKNQGRIGPNPKQNSQLSVVPQSQMRSESRLSAKKQKKKVKNVEETLYLASKHENLRKEINSKRSHKIGKNESFGGKLQNQSSENIPKMSQNQQQCLDISILKKLQKHRRSPDLPLQRSSLEQRIRIPQTSARSRKASRNETGIIQAQTMISSSNLNKNRQQRQQNSNSQRSLSRSALRQGSSTFGGAILMRHRGSQQFVRPRSQARLCEMETSQQKAIVDIGLKRLDGAEKAVGCCPGSERQRSPSNQSFRMRKQRKQMSEKSSCEKVRSRSKDVTRRLHVSDLHDSVPRHDNNLRQKKIKGISGKKIKQQSVVESEFVESKDQISDVEIFDQNDQLFRNQLQDPEIQILSHQIGGAIQTDMQNFTANLLPRPFTETLPLQECTSASKQGETGEIEDHIGVQQAINNGQIGQDLMNSRDLEQMEAQSQQQESLILTKKSDQKDHKQFQTNSFQQNLKQIDTALQSAHQESIRSTNLDENIEMNQNKDQRGTWDLRRDKYNMVNQRAQKAAENDSEGENSPHVASYSKNELQKLVKFFQKEYKNAQESLLKSKGELYEQKFKTDILKKKVKELEISGEQLHQNNEYLSQCVQNYENEENQQNSQLNNLDQLKQNLSEMQSTFLDQEWRHKSDIEQIEGAEQQFKESQHVYLKNQRQFVKEIVTVTSQLEASISDNAQDFIQEMQKKIIHRNEQDSAFEQEIQSIAQKNKGKIAITFNNIYKTLKKLNDAIIQQKKELNSAQDSNVIREIRQKQTEREQLRLENCSEQRQEGNALFVQEEEEDRNSVKLNFDTQKINQEDGSDSALVSQQQESVKQDYTENQEGQTTQTQQSILSEVNQIYENEEVEMGDSQNQQNQYLNNQDSQNYMKAFFNEFQVHTQKNYDQQNIPNDLSEQFMLTELVKKLSGDLDTVKQQSKQLLEINQDLKRQNGELRNKYDSTAKIENSARRDSSSQAQQSRQANSSRAQPPLGLNVSGALAAQSSSKELRKAQKLHQQQVAVDNQQIIFSPTNLSSFRDATSQVLSRENEALHADNEQLVQLVETLKKSQKSQDLLIQYLQGTQNSILQKMQHQAIKSQFSYSLIESAQLAQSFLQGRAADSLPLQVSTSGTKKYDSQGNQLQNQFTTNTSPLISDPQSKQNVFTKPLQANQSTIDDANQQYDEALPQIQKAGNVNHAQDCSLNFTRNDQNSTEQDRQIKFRSQTQLESAGNSVQRCETKEIGGNSASIGNGNNYNEQSCQSLRGDRQPSKAGSTLKSVFTLFGNKELLLDGGVNASQLEAHQHSFAEAPLPSGSQNGLQQAQNGIPNEQQFQLLNQSEIQVNQALSPVNNFEAADYNSNNAQLMNLVRQIQGDESFQSVYGQEKLPTPNNLNPLAEILEHKVPCNANNQITESIEDLNNQRQTILFSQELSKSDEIIPIDQEKESTSIDKRDSKRVRYARRTSSNQRSSASRRMGSAALVTPTEDLMYHDGSLLSSAEMDLLTQSESHIDTKGQTLKTRDQKEIEQIIASTKPTTSGGGPEINLDVNSSSNCKSKEQQDAMPDSTTIATTNNDQNNRLQEQMQKHTNAFRDECEVEPSVITQKGERRMEVKNLHQLLGGIQIGASDIQSSLPVKSPQFNQTEMPLQMTTQPDSSALSKEQDGEESKQKNAENFPINFGRNMSKSGPGFTNKANQNVESNTNFYRGYSQTQSQEHLCDTNSIVDSVVTGKVLARESQSEFSQNQTQKTVDDARSQATQQASAMTKIEQQIQKRPAHKAKNPSLTSHETSTLLPIENGFFQKENTLSSLQERNPLATGSLSHMPTEAAYLPSARTNTFFGQNGVNSTQIKEASVDGRYSPFKTYQQMKFLNNSINNCNPHTSSAVHHNLSQYHSQMHLHNQTTLQNSSLFTYRHDVKDVSRSLSSSSQRNLVHPSPILSHMANNKNGINDLGRQSTTQASAYLRMSRSTSPHEPSQNKPINSALAASEERIHQRTKGLYQKIDCIDREIEQLQLQNEDISR